MTALIVALSMILLGKHKVVIELMQMQRTLAVTFSALAKRRHSSGSSRLSRSVADLSQSQLLLSTIKVSKTIRCGLTIKDSFILESRCFKDKIAAAGKTRDHRLKWSLIPRIWTSSKPIWLRFRCPRVWESHGPQRDQTEAGLEIASSRIFQY